MSTRYHFISGLPRSGSTLLSAILRQNPAIHAGMSSPVAQLVQQVHENMGPRSEFATMITNEQRRDVLRAVVDAFYRSVPPGHTVVDTNRVWCSRMPLLTELFPDARVIVCVRDLMWVMDSFERAVRRNPYSGSRMFRQQDAVSIQARMHALAGPGGTVGMAWNATQEAFYGDHADRLLVVDYEALARDPKRAVDAVYEHLGLEPFEHDFENVSYGEGESFDAQIGVPGLHAVQQKVSYTERETVLTPELVERFSGRNFWRRPGGNPRDVKVVLPKVSGDRPRRPGLMPGQMGARMVRGRPARPLGEP